MKEEGMKNVRRALIKGHGLQQTSTAPVSIYLEHTHSPFSWIPSHCKDPTPLSPWRRIMPSFLGRSSSDSMGLEV